MTDDELPAFWRDLGVPGVFDVHAHFMPERVLRKVWGYFDSAERGGYGRPWPITYRHDEDERLGRLRALGARRFTALLYPHKPGMAAWLNGWAAEFAARTPDAVHSATFHPEPSAARYVAEAIEAGARVFKAHVQVGDYDPRDRLLDPVWGLLSDAAVPVVVHCGSGPLPGRFTGIGPISEVLARHPGLTLVIAHAGLPEYADFLALAEEHPRVYLDTTMVFTDFTEVTTPYPRELLPRLARLADRVLFGSDFPNIPHPYAHQVAALAGLGLGEEWLRSVVWDNAATLFGPS
ncbi:MAG TPA: amidohydrolase family protein [Thermopolyspora sp.]